MVIAGFLNYQQYILTSIPDMDSVRIPPTKTTNFHGPGWSWNQRPSQKYALGLENQPFISMHS